MVSTTSRSVIQLLDEHLVCLNLGGETKEEVIIGLTEMLQGDPRINNFELMRDAVLERERMMSTGVGKGIALPHAKTAAVNGITLAFATTAQPIDFNAVDNVPVRILFLILSAENEKTTHIKLLSRISRMMNDDSIREQLLKAENSREIIKIFKVKEQA
ncbi:MAG: PTS sugar transporter subunit IIA [Rhodothermaceae bacterium]|nr:PTS sugar transporter subunit IIA [Rhodothermaceae bacterium]